MLDRSVPRVKLPSGREATPFDALRFCYNLSETDIEVLLTLLNGEKYDVDSLAAKLGLSKATVNRALNKLVSMGFVRKEREPRRAAGRPKYLYSVANPEELLHRIEGDLELCARIFKEELKSSLLAVLTGYKQPAGN